MGEACQSCRHSRRVALNPTLDDIEEALIASDLGPEASHRIRDAIGRQKFERLDERGLRTILAEEIEKILAPVAATIFAHFSTSIFTNGAN